MVVRCRGYRLDCRRTRRAPAALWRPSVTLSTLSIATHSYTEHEFTTARSRLGSAAGFRGVMPPRGRAHCCSYLVLNLRGYSDSHTHMSNRRTPGPAALLRSGADIRGATRRRRDRRDRHDPRRSSAAVPRSRASKSRRPGAGPPRSAEFGSTCLLACRQVASGRHDDCVETASRRFKFTSQILGHELGVGALASGDPETARPHE